MPSVHRLDDLEESAIKKLSSRKQRKLREALERKKAKRPGRGKDKAAREAANIFYSDRQEDKEEDESLALNTDDDEEEEDSVAVASDTGVVNPLDEKKYTPYTHRRRKGRLGSSQEKDLPSLGEDSEGEREDAEAQKEADAATFSRTVPPPPSTTFSKVTLYCSRVRKAS